jgi:hypothetical protein
VTAIEFYGPLIQVAGFIGGWVAAMVTGVMFLAAR